MTVYSFAEIRNAWYAQPAADRYRCIKSFTLFGLIVALVAYGMMLPSAPTCELSQLKMTGVHTVMLDDGSRSITGVMTNNSAVTVNGLTLTWHLYDKAGAQVGKATASIDGLKAGGKWRFTAPCDALIFAKTGSCNVSYY